MIGLKPKKKKSQASVEDLPIEGQARIEGTVTERNIFTGTITNAVGAVVKMYKQEVLVGFTSCNEDGKYIITRIDAGDHYKLEISKDSMIVTPLFSLASQEIKQVETELTTDNFS